ncbi:CYTH domain-containing protein [Paludibacter sp. 221]|uniref:CYTH domain-containing protein n=1 Tax=Paludibacter sp. 221 TaxID=2302939 RepID=UPI0013CFD49B|nr:CYTH domain-containing protein [Paludibacter sp. 221]NDV46554.1 CYTH domain-containing protein [Paludibacter sp. 221]
MPQEIERKFLVKSEIYKSEATKVYPIMQGYLCRVPERTVRIRVKGDKGYITIKGKSNDNGISRYEWENEIALEEAKELIKLSASGIIDKTRYEVPYGGHVFEVDEFHGDNEGLVVAEIELQAEDELFETPAWVGEEVTNVKKYYNSHLSEKPYKMWEK